MHKLLTVFLYQRDLCEFLSFLRVAKMVSAPTYTDVPLSFCRE